ncbi:MAG TPA: hypothetical protein P5205_08290 [Candidatus Paceibacterota bacterium]|nr:hypothetical protein [Verrucomicrobiota bacterium]HSA10358.1 hypothetical protein [Candidatus Paceibacterota bacterium]
MNDRLPPTNRPSDGLGTPARLSIGTVRSTREQLDECVRLEKLEPLRKLQVRASQAKEIGRLWRQQLSLS